MKRGPVWVHRPFLNWRDVYEWGDRAGVRKMMPPDQIHLTLATVRSPVDWSALVARTDELVIPAGPKPCQIFAYTIKALTFVDDAVAARHAELLALLPAMDHPRLRAHVSLYKGGRMPRVEYDGPLVFGPEEISEFDATNVGGIKHVVIRDMLQGHATG